MVVALAGLAVSPAAAKPAKAKSAATPAAGMSTKLAAQQKQIDAQRALIEQQRDEIARQWARIDSESAVADTQAVALRAQQAALDSLRARMELMQRRVDELSSQSGLPAVQEDLESRLEKVEAATQKSPELPPDVVSAGDFPGSIRIPGSDAAIKFGGRIRTAVVLTLDPLGTDDRFLTNSIPVGQVTSGEEKRTNISARASRLNSEFRTPGGLEEVRAFFEGDFAGASNTFRLRHAYAQYRGFIAGQTWSTFSDPNADHHDLDFEGVSSENQIRQPLLRYWWSPRPGRRFAVAAETPSVSVTGGQGVNLFPDVVARGYFPIQNDQGHIQVAGVLRQIRAQTAGGFVASVWGGGGTVSGVLPIRVHTLTDRLIFQLNGGVGIARYINDLQSLGGQDGFVDSTNRELKALPAIGWYVAFEHTWKVWPTLSTMNLNSTVLWSFVDVRNLDFQPPDAYHQTHRLAVNTILSPSKRVDLGLEYIYGSRENKDGALGRANQVQAVALIRF